MRIVCPACNATYEVPASLLEGAPRALRCARCQNEWYPTPEPMPEPAAAAARRPAPSPVLGLAERAAGLTALSAAESLRADSLRADSLRSDSLRSDPLHIEPMLPVPPPVPVAPPAPDGPLTAPPPLVGRPERGGRRGPALAWGASLLLIVALLAAAYAWRAGIEAAWPPSQRLYAILGLS